MKWEHQNQVGCNCPWSLRLVDLTVRELPMWIFFYLKTLKPEIREEAAVPSWLIVMMMELAWEPGCPWCWMLPPPLLCCFSFRQVEGMGAFSAQDKLISVQRGCHELSLCYVLLFPEKAPCCWSGEECGSGDTDEEGEGGCSSSGPITPLLLLLLWIQHLHYLSCLCTLSAHLFNTGMSLKHFLSPSPPT